MDGTHSRFIGHSQALAMCQGPFWGFVQLECRFTKKVELAGLEPATF